MLEFRKPNFFFMQRKKRQGQKKKRYDYKVRAIMRILLFFFRLGWFTLVPYFHKQINLLKNIHFFLLLKKLSLQNICWFVMTNDVNSIKDRKQTLCFRLSIKCVSNWIEVNMILLHFICTLQKIDRIASANKTVWAI